ncbi:MAG: hypothetical protein A2Y14_00600 [Verrucomicrobia bacterium GWF2_51_19]|nr:MAG: hypothetical protein A2Y14_00600 [Verrucomicrobia bacterium GWF2_51_19]HCJ11628.1 transcriptional regulator [Opitutae bacterium]
MKLDRILSQNEGKRLEFKRDISSPVNILRAVVAFANTAGGMIVIGVDDRTHHVLGIHDAQKEEERLANFIAESIEPKVIPDIRVVPYRETQTIVVHIPFSQHRPHFLKRLGEEAGVFVRIGSTNRQADENLIEEMRRVVLTQSFDEIGLTEYSEEVIDRKLVERFFEDEHDFSSEHYLESLRIVRRYQGKLVPTIGGMLLFGKDKAKLFPDAWVQCGLFSGITKANLLATEEFFENLPIALEKAFDFIQRHNLRTIERGNDNVPMPKLPIMAIRELLVNAVMHADYSQKGSPIQISIFDDRVEIENPGILISGIVIEDLYQGITRTRNRVISRLFREKHYAELWGSGVHKVLEACKQNKIPGPIFEEIGMRFRSTLFLRSSPFQVLDSRDHSILQFLREDHGFTLKDIARYLHCAPSNVQQRLPGLVNRSFVHVQMRTEKDPHQRYFITKNYMQFLQHRKED